MALSLLLAAALLQAPAGPVRFDCEIPRRRVSVAREPLRLTITLAVEGPHIASVLLDGPPIFSSYRPIRERRDGSVPPTAETRLLPRNMQWHGDFQGRAIRLRRERTDMVLEPRPANPGLYAGYWNYVAASEGPRVEANGVINCRLIAGTLNESARS